MSDDDYLWNRTGHPDPEIERLEQVLGTLRSARPPTPLDQAPRARPRLLAWVLGLGLTAAAAALGGLLLGRGQPGAPATGPAARAEGSGWVLTTLAGQPRVEGRSIGEKDWLAAGQAIETDDDSRARLLVPSLGSVEVGVQTRVRLAATGASGHRLQLDRGALQVTLVAPPRMFVVGTSAGVAVDLGCAYTIAVDDQGEGVVRVTSGWVGFQKGPRESLVPQGAECALRAAQGPGTPTYSDVSERFRRAVAALDGPAGPFQQANALGTVLAEARPRDALTLWHLLARLPEEARPSVLRRLVALVPVASGVPRARVLAADRAALDQLWERLGLGPIADWRPWTEGPHPGPDR
jgi:hypothetical protein